MWDQRNGQQTILTPTPHPAPASTLIDPGYGPRTSKTDHRSPAKIRRDAERAEQKRLNDQIDQCLKIRSAEKIELEERLEDYQHDERTIVEANSWTDIGLPRYPTSTGVVPWPGEKVSTISSKLLHIDEGEVLQRKRGRRIIYVHASMIPR